MTDSNNNQYLTFKNYGTNQFLDAPANGNPVDQAGGNTTANQEWGLSELPGFWAYTTQGNVDNETGAPWFGSLGGNVNDVKGMAVTADGQGYWLVEFSSSAGVTVTSYGYATPNVATFTLGSGCSVQGVASDYKAGFWVYDTCGNVYAEAGADSTLAQQKVCTGSSIAAIAGAVPIGTQDGGYWVVCANGTVVPFGASPNGLTQIQPPAPCAIKGAATDPAGGFWVYDTCGNVTPEDNSNTTFGDRHCTASCVSGMAAAPDGQGYWLIGQTIITNGTSTSTVYHYGDATGFAGNQITATNTHLLIGVVADPNI